MTDYKEFFKGKKITIMGLGLLGRGLGYTKFLAECGADLIVTDLKTEDQLATSLKSLSKYNLPAGEAGKIKYVLGEHRLEDFKGRDMVIKAAGVPLESPYIREAIKNKIPVEMDVSLFAKLAPEVPIVGITGTRGKSMTTALIYHILSENLKGKSVFLGGNVRGVATLPLLQKVKKGDVLVAELDSWQLQGFGDAGISPHVAVFTNFMQDHMNYYKGSMTRYLKDKANIFKYQRPDDVLVLTADSKRRVASFDIKSKIMLARGEDVADWDFVVPGEHQRDNLACAVLATQAMGVPLPKIRKSVASFKGLEGRLELLRTYKGVKIYNDNNATTPKATIAGIRALRPKPDQEAEGRLILIFGGADKVLFLGDLRRVINKSCYAAFALPGSGTNRFKETQSKTSKDDKIKYVKDLEGAIKGALDVAHKGDTILFSPGFASFGAYQNEYERNDLFIKIIKRLK